MLSYFIPFLFRKKFYSTVAELQKDIDSWLTSYNNERAHSGKHYSIYIAKNKNIANIAFATYQDY